MSDKASQLYERALRNLKNSVGRAWARRNESQIRVPEKLLAAAQPTPADAPVIPTTSARALISSERHPHLNPLSAPPSRDPGEADAKRLVRVFSIFLPSS